MKNIVETVGATSFFKTLATAIQKAGLTDTLGGTGPFTVFAPTDDAFAKIPKDKLDAALADGAKLKTILNNHVVTGKLMAKDIGSLKEVKALSGNTLAITNTDGIKVDSAMVTKSDFECANGVIHTIDTVLIPA